MHPGCKDEVDLFAINGLEQGEDQSGYINIGSGAVINR